MVNQCKIARFKRHAAQQPLEAQLVGLRQREEEVAQAAPEDTPISTEVITYHFSSWLRFLLFDFAGSGFR